MKRVIIISVFAIMLVPVMAYSQDGEIWFGQPDGSPLVFRIDSEESVPVWLKTNPDMFAAAAHLPLSSDDRFISERLGGKLFKPFLNENPPEGFDRGWDSAFLMEPISHQDRNGFTSQGVMGFSDLAGKPNVHLNCEQQCKIIEFKVHTAADDSLRGHTYDVFIEGFDPRSKGIRLSDTLGVKTYEIESHFSQVHFLYPGDINADFIIDRRDIEFLENVLKGNENIPWPKSRGDCNNDGVVDTVDVNYLGDFLNDRDSQTR